MRLHAGGAREFVFNAFHLAPLVEGYVGRLGAEPPFAESELRCVVETDLLGTAGGVRGMARDREHLLVWNGDIYAPDVDVSQVITLGRQEWPVLLVAPPASGQGTAASGAATRGTATRGTVGLDAQGRVVRLRSYASALETQSADYIGIAVLPAAFVRSLPGQGCLVGDGLLPWLASGKPVTTLNYGGHWSDGGTIAQYLTQNRHWLERQRVDNHFGRGVVLAPDVKVVGSVIGDGARVSGAGVIERSVIWPGADVRAPAADAVVLSDGRVVFGPGAVRGHA